MELCEPTKGEFKSNLSSLIFAGGWLTKKRLDVYPRLFLAMSIAAIVLMLMTANGNLDWQGKPLGTDFCSFYSAGRLALEGNASRAYDAKDLYAKEKAAVNSNKIGYYTFIYPPTFLVLLAPLAALPYLAALALWLGITLGFFVLMIRKLSNNKRAVILALAFPATFLTIGHGQNAFLTTGLLAGMLYYLDRRPIVAGVMIGLLTFKPHLGVLIPIVLLATGHWRVFAAATVTTLCSTAVSFVAFGAGTWQAFLNSNALAFQILNEGLVSYHKMQSLFASLRLMGLATSPAYVLHAILALMATIAVTWVWRQPVNSLLKAAALATGSLMVTPFLLDYDLTILSIPIACLAVIRNEIDFNTGLINLLAVAWLAPILLRFLNGAVAFPWAPLLLSVLLYKIIMIAREERLEMMGTACKFHP